MLNFVSTQAKHETMSGASDNIIFKRIKNDDKDAFNILFEEYYAPLCEFSYRIISDKQAAEEIVADVFANIWIKRRKITITSSLKSYLFISTKNTTLSYLRKIKNKNVNIEGMMNFEPVDGSNPEKEVISKENLRSYEQILLIIPEKSRMVFMMHRFDKLKYREISEILGISIKTVEKHMGKAIKLMRDYAKQSGILGSLFVLFVKFLMKF